MTSFPAEAFKFKLAGLLDGVAADNITLTITAASVKVQASISMPPGRDTDAQSQAGVLSSRSPQDLSAALGVTIQSISAIQVELRAVYTSSPPSPLSLIQSGPNQTDGNLMMATVSTSSLIAIITVVTAVIAIIMAIIFRVRHIRSRNDTRTAKTAEVTSGVVPTVTVLGGKKTPSLFNLRRQLNVRPRVKDQLPGPLESVATLTQSAGGAIPPTGADGLGSSTSPAPQSAFGESTIDASILSEVPAANSANQRRFLESYFADLYPVSVQSNYQAGSLPTADPEAVPPAVAVSASISSSEAQRQGNSTLMRIRLQTDLDEDSDEPSLTESYADVCSSPPSSAQGEFSNDLSVSSSAAVSPVVSSDDSMEGSSRSVSPTLSDDELPGGGSGFGTASSSAHGTASGSRATSPRPSELSQMPPFRRAPANNAERLRRANEVLSMMGAATPPDGGIVTPPLTAQIRFLDRYLDEIHTADSIEEEQDQHLVI